jgi:hypothetical protein
MLETMSQQSLVPTLKDHMVGRGRCSIRPDNNVETTDDIEWQRDAPDQILFAVLVQNDSEPLREDDTRSFPQ